MSLVLKVLPLVHFAISRVKHSTEPTLRSFFKYSWGGDPYYSIHLRQ